MKRSHKLVCVCVIMRAAPFKAQTTPDFYSGAGSGLAEVWLVCKAGKSNCKVQK